MTKEKNQNDTQQEIVYNSIAYPIVESVLEGYNGTLFKYGYTDTEKSQSISGQDEPISERGIIPKSFKHIFRSIKGTSNTQFLVYASFIEIYNQQIRDLLSNNSKQFQLRQKLETVDLAGSENQSKIQAMGSRLKEAVHINLSFTTLGNVISSLIDPKAAYPYRDSKLARILQDSLGGHQNCNEMNIDPADYNCDETISTLRHAHRVKYIQNSAKIKEDLKQALIRKFQDEICSQKQQLSGFLESGRDISQNGEVKPNNENEVKKIQEDKQLQVKEKQQLIQQFQENQQKQQQQNQQQQKLLDQLYKMQHKIIYREETFKRDLENERQLNKQLQQVKERDSQTTLQIQQNEDFMQEMNKKYRNQVEEKLEKQKKIDNLFLRLNKFNKFFKFKKITRRQFQEEQQNWVFPIQDLTYKCIRKSSESQVSLKEIQSKELEQDQNIYFVCKEEGLIREVICGYEIEALYLNTDSFLNFRVKRLEFNITYNCLILVQENLKVQIILLTVLNSHLKDELQ
ncbi:hypothetical protein ABPG74_008739 [Tetrahymena malaccensis]